jgi:hypothetical protein
MPQQFAEYVANAYAIRFTVRSQLVAAMWPLTVAAGRLVCGNEVVEIFEEPHQFGAAGG